MDQKLYDNFVKVLANQLESGNTAIASYACSIISMAGRLTYPDFSAIKLTQDILKAVCVTTRDTGFEDIDVELDKAVNKVKELDSVVEDALGKLQRSN
jgi:hypothetical protein